MAAKNKLVELFNGPSGVVYISVDSGPDADVYHQNVSKGYAKEDSTWKLAFGWARESDVVFDVGANIGAYSIAMASKGAQVVSFELLDSNITHLKAALSANGYSAKIVNGAVSDKRGAVGVTGDSAWAAVDPRAEQQVQSVIIDEWALENNVQRVDFIKIDVEGSEMAALRGARSIINRSKPDMLIEANVITSGLHGYPYQDIVRFAESSGYRTFRVANGRLYRPIERVQECICTDYFFSTKSDSEIAERSPLPLASWTPKDIKDSILYQEKEGPLHCKYVATIAGTLSNEIVADPEVATRIAKWRGLDIDETMVQALKVGAGVV